MSIDRRIDFLNTVLGPFIKLETLLEARAALQEKMLESLKLALYCVGQHGLTVNSWEFIGPRSKIVYVGEPERILRFDMMAEKTLVVLSGLGASKQRLSRAPLRECVRLASCQG